MVLVLSPYCFFNAFQCVKSDKIGNGPILEMESYCSFTLSFLWSYTHLYSFFFYQKELVPVIDLDILRRRGLIPFGLNQFLIGCMRYQQVRHLIGNGP